MIGGYEQRIMVSVVYIVLKRFPLAAMFCSKRKRSFKSHLRVLNRIETFWPVKQDVFCKQVMVVRGMEGK